ncbi:MAG: hypothetical protein WC712_04765, partial [Candidatus Brocadiia bacterium]
MANKSSRRNQVDPLDDLIGIDMPSGDATPAHEKLKNFFVAYYKPVAVLLAIVILFGVALYVYSTVQNKKMLSAVAKLKDADSYEKITDPELINLVKGTPLEYEWNVKKLERMVNRKRPGEGSKEIDYQSYIDEAEKFLEKYPRYASAPVIRYNVATYYVFLGQIDKAIENYKKVAEHPEARLFKEVAEREIELLNDYKKDPKLDENYRAALEAHGKELLATPTPLPSPTGPVTLPSVPP